MKGIEIAKELNISTSALRHYGSWGLVPPVERAANGYRMYTEEHKAYFQCIRALLPGFGMDLIKEVMPLIKKGAVVEALWKLNQAQVNLHTEKETVRKTVELLQLKEFTDMPSYHKQQYVTIGEAAREANVSASSIRHWEKEGLIDPPRHKESGFRMFGPADIRRLFVIRTVQRAAFSLDIVREVLSDLEKNNVTQAREMAIKSMEYLDYALIEQLRGAAALQHLLDTIANKGK